MDQGAGIAGQPLEVFQNRAWRDQVAPALDATNIFVRFGYVRSNERSK